jgi:pyridoxine kinase
LSIQRPELDALLAPFACSPWGAEINLVLTGYCASGEQVAAVVDHLRAMRANGLGPAVVCDPVSGDAAGPYVSPDVRAAQRGLVEHADILTPNRHELGLLTDLPVTTNREIVIAARSLGRPQVLVTSAHAMRPRSIANLLVTADAVRLAELPAIDGAPKGTGDLMTAVFAAQLLDGIEATDAMAHAVAVVHDLVAETVRLKRDELALVAGQDILQAPRSRPFVTDLRV